MTTQEKIREKFQQLSDIVVAKNADYGDSVFEHPVLCPNMPIPSAILVRMSDKIKRLIQLMCHPAKVKDETIIDTLDDLAAYSVLLSIQMGNKEKPQPMTVTPTQYGDNY